MASKESVSTSQRATFSGHETFQCKRLWLKKGYDYLQKGKSFRDEDAVVELGVGKNMVNSLRYWLRAFGITAPNDTPTAIGELIFSDGGYDPFLEDVQTLWLLHYLLVSTNYATLYNILFSAIHQERESFSKQYVEDYIKHQFDEEIFHGVVYNKNTIHKDVTTLLKLYVPPQGKNLDDLTSALIDLNALKAEKNDTYRFNVYNKTAVDPLIFLYAIKSIAGNDCVVEYSKLLQLARIFCLTQGEMYEIFNAINKQINDISFSNTAGEQLFSINCTISEQQVLSMYYRG